MTEPTTGHDRTRPAAHAEGDHPTPPGTDARGCEFCTPEAARRCPDPQCRAQRLGETPGTKADNQVHQRLDDAESLFRDVVRGAVTVQMDERISLAWRVFKEELASLYGSEPSEPAPDLAGDDDAPREPLRDRAIRALAACDARWNDDTGDWDTPASEYLAQMGDAALAVVQPELDRLRDEAAKWHQKHLNTRVELADMTGQRDRIERYWQSSGETVGAVSRALEQALGREHAEAADDLPGMVDMLRRRANSAEAERDVLQARIEAALNWCDGTEDGYENQFERGYLRCAERVRMELQPADDGSETGWKYGDRVVATVPSYTDPIVGTYRRRCDHVYSIITDDDGEMLRVHTYSLRPVGGEG